MAGPDLQALFDRMLLIVHKTNDLLIQKLPSLHFVKKPRKGPKKVYFEDGEVVTLPYFLKQLHLTLKNVVFLPTPSE